MRSMVKARRLSEELGLEPIDLPMGPWPVGDEVGFQLAIVMLRASQEKGRNSRDYVQFDSVRKLRSAFSTVHENSAVAAQDVDVFKGDMGQTFGVTNSNSDSHFFRKFCKGLEKRMGRLVIQNLGIGSEVVCLILDMLEEELGEDELKASRKREITLLGAGFVYLYVAALRGNELFLTERRELCKRISQGEKHPLHPHTVLPLKGLFKGESGERNIIFCLTNKTQSGIPVRKWTERLVNLMIQEKKDSSVGPAFCDESGFALNSSYFDEHLHRMLGIIQTKFPELVDPGVQVTERFYIYRSFRRGSNTRAREMKVDSEVVDLNNRWRKVQMKSGGKPRVTMAALYLELTQVLGSQTEYSKAM